MISRLADMHIPGIISMGSSVLSPLASRAQCYIIIIFNSFTIVHPTVSSSRYKISTPLFGKVQRQHFVRNIRRN